MPESAIAQLADHRLNVGDGDRIDSRKRLVEQEKARLDCERASDFYAPALAARKAVAARVNEGTQAELFKQRRQPPFLFVARDAVLLPDQANVIADRKLAKDRVLLGQVSDAVARTRVHRRRREIDFAVAECRASRFHRRASPTRRPYKTSSSCRRRWVRASPTTSPVPTSAETPLTTVRSP